MILSMTGYGCANSAIPLDTLPNQNIAGVAELNVELRSVNGRFLDFYFRLPEECRSIEPSLRKLLTQHIARGKIECRVQIKYPNGFQHKTILDTTTLEQTKHLVQQIIDYFPQAAPFSISDILQLPGILQEPKISQTALETILLSCTENALQQFNLSLHRRVTPSHSCCSGKQTQCLTSLPTFDHYYLICWHYNKKN